jgi:hypothetical protein
MPFLKGQHRDRYEQSVNDNLRTHLMTTLMRHSKHRPDRICVLLVWILALAGCQTHVVSPSNNQAAELKAKLESVSNDWPNLARYRADNARLGPPIFGEVRVIFLGDSITDAWPNVGNFFPGTIILAAALVDRPHPRCSCGSNRMWSRWNRRWS